MQRIFNDSYTRVYNATIKALERLDSVIEYNDEGKGAISASTKTTIFSWGESVDIRITRQGASNTVVNVESNSKAQLISWGKNERNEEEILETINQILG